MCEMLFYDRYGGSLPLAVLNERKFQVHLIAAIYC